MKRFIIDEQVPAGSGFSPDEKYFDSMQMQVLQKLKSEPRSIPLYRRLWMPAAAAVLLISMLLTFTFYEAPPEELADATAIENYLTYGTQLTPYDIASHLSDQDIDMLETDLGLDDHSIESMLLQNPNIDQYLLN